ncbi:MAG: phasin family protein [Alphaproteobacteria bacterium]|nr:phasin family protein [Alphaproteobacteria bacterium]MBF0391623.1 phasin family protein [Alphaproteobacteria bacterium]
MAKMPESFFDFDITKFMAEMKVPGLDMDAILSSQRRNIEALNAANAMAMEGLAAVMKRQMEILRQTVEEVSTATRDLAEPGAPEHKVARQAELTKETFERTLGNMRELSEIVARSNSDAFDLLNKRFSQILDETRDMMLSGKK